MVQAGDGSRNTNRLLPITSIASHDAIERAIQSIAADLIDDAILNVAFEVHRSMKKGLLSLEVGSVEDEEEFLQVTTEGLDVFGQAPAKKQQECVCPNCSRNLAASRFAPHLEKCMGMGRNSSRIASRRIQNNSRDSSSNHGGVGCASDEDDDDDWLMDRKRRKRDKNSPRRSRNSKMKSDAVSSSSSSVANNNYEMILSSGTIEEKKVVLTQICAVTSEHTRKMCLRSVRCPQHSGEQRRAIRDQYLLTGDDSLSSLGSSTTRGADSTSGNGRSSLQDVDEVQVDIDGLDEANLASWDHDLSNTTSPADSTSTNNSTSSINRRSNNKSRKKSSKSSKSSNSSHSSLVD